MNVLNVGYEMSTTTNMFFPEKITTPNSSLLSDNKNSESMVHSAEWLVRWQKRRGASFCGLRGRGAASSCARGR